MSALRLIWLVLALADAGVAVDHAGDPAGSQPAEAPKAPTAPPPQVTFDCAPKPVQAGEPLICTLTARHVPEVTIFVPAPPGAEEIAPGMGTTSAGASVPVEGGLLETSRRFSLVQFELEDIEVPNLEITWRDASGGEGRIAVVGPSVPIKRITANKSEVDFRTFEKLEGRPDDEVEAFWTAHGPVPYVVTNWPLIIICVVLLGAAVGFGIGWVVYRWVAAQRQAAAPYVDTRPAHVIAFEALERLAADRLPEHGEVKSYYFRLSEIVRGYMERRFAFLALEMTSDEIRSSIRAHEVTVEGQLAIEDFLAETDLVKFADFNPTDSAIDTVFRSARGIVELTREPDETPAAQNTEGSAVGGPRAPTAEPTQSESDESARGDADARAKREGTS